MNQSPAIAFADTTLAEIAREEIANYYREVDATTAREGNQLIHSEEKVTALCLRFDKTAVYERAAWSRFEGEAILHFFKALRTLVGRHSGETPDQDVAVRIVLEEEKAKILEHFGVAMAAPAGAVMIYGKGRFDGEKYDPEEKRWHPVHLAFEDLWMMREAANDNAPTRGQADHQLTVTYRKSLIETDTPGMKV